MRTRRRDFCVVALLLAGAIGEGAYAQTPPPGRGKVYVGDSPAAQDMLEQARALRQQNRLLEAANLYQQIAEEYADKLMEWNGIYTDSARRVTRDLAADAPLLEAYRKAFEPTAQRALAAANSPEELEAVAAKYRVCRAGLEAQLRVAGDFLERGQPVDASTVLEGWDDHPDMQALAPRWNMLQAQAALLSGHPERAERYVAALTAAKDRAALTSLEQLVAALRLPPAPPSYDSMAQLPRTATLDKPGKPLWQVVVPDPMGDESKTRGRGVQFGEGGVGGMAGSSSGNMTPQADEQRIFVNNYLTVMALDRLSGRVAWMFQPPELVGGQVTVAPWLRMQGRLPDQRGFAFDGQNALTVVGLAMAGNPQFQPAGAATALICLDRETGKLRWRLEPKEIDASLLGASFHGTPAVAGGRAFVLLRRSHFSGFQDAFVVAVDTQTGQVAWRRYLSSSAAMNRSAGRGMAQMLVERGKLYLADSLGVAACLDARSGMVWWLSVLPGASDVVDMNNMGARMGMRQVGNSWQASPPVLLEAGLVVPGLTDAEPALLIDPQTGSLLRKLSGVPWSETDYFTRAGNDVLCVGPTVHRVDGKTLEPTWSHKLGKDAPVIRPQGRAALTIDRLIVPVTGDKIVTLNLADGAEVALDALAPAGNLLVLDDQLVVADGTTVRDYMDWARAYRRLKERIAQQPDDPRAALALAYLALAANERDAALEGVDEALAAMRKGGATLTPARQRDAFTQLLALAETPTAQAPLRRSIFERLASAATGPADQVAYHLGAGAFAAESGETADAAEHYQTILMDPAMGGELYQRAAASRQAGLEARSRLEALIKKFGPQAYERFDTMAAQRLAELNRQAPDAAALLELVRQFPLAKCVPAAISQAAAALEAAGDVRGASAQLRRAYSMATEAADLGAIAGRLGQVLARSGQPRQAMRWLERVRREHPGLELQRDGHAVTADAWLAELAKLPAGDQALPALAMPLGQPEVLPGRLLAPTDQPQEAWPRDRVLLFTSAQQLVLRSGPKLAVAWTLPLVGLGEFPAPERFAGVELLAFHSDQAVLWSAVSSTLLTVDLASGKPAWPMVEARALLNQVGGEAERRAARTMEERNFERFVNPGNLVMRNGRLRNVDQLRAEMGNAVYVASGEGVLVFADRLGRVVALDRKTGRRLWQLICPLDEVSGVDLVGDTLMVVGTNGAQTDVVSGHILLLDPATGEPRLPMLEEKSPIAWSSLGVEGNLVYCTASELVGRQTGDGRVAWRTPVNPVNGVAPSLRLSDDLLFMLDSSGGLAVLDPTTGQVLNRLAASPAPGQGPGLDVRVFEQQWQVLTPAQAIALGPDAKVRWRDAINPFGKQLVMQMLGERNMVVLNLASSPRMAMAGAAGVPGGPGVGLGPVPVPGVVDRVPAGLRIRGQVNIGGGLEDVVFNGPMPPEAQQRLRVAIRAEMERKAAAGRAAAPAAVPPAVPNVAPNVAPPAVPPAVVPPPPPAPAAAPAPAPAVAAIKPAPPMPSKEAAAAADKAAEAIERQVAAAAAAGLEQAKAERLRQERVAQARAQAATQKAAVVPAPAQAGANVARQPAGQMAQQAAGAADLQGLAMAARQFAGGGGQPPPPPQPVQQQGDDLFAVAAPPGPWVYKLYVLDRYSGVLVEERDLTPLSEAIDPAHAVFLDNRVVLTAGDSTVVIPGAVK